MEGYSTESYLSGRLFARYIIVRILMDRRRCDGWVNDKKTKWQKAIFQGSN